MSKSVSAAECLKQAEECIQLAEVTSDPKLRDLYLKLAGDLTHVAAMLQAKEGGESPPDDPEPPARAERGVPNKKRRK